jgi:Flp pilus assembly protein TadG
MEFALILSVFLLLTFGTIDFGRGVWTYNTLSHAAREATRYAVVHGAWSQYPASSEQIKEIITKQAAGLDPQKVVVTTSWQPNNEPGSVVQVQAQYNFKPVTPLIFSETIVLRSTSRMVISY